MVDKDRLGSDYIYYLATDFCAKTHHVWGVLNKSHWPLCQQSLSCQINHHISIQVYNKIELNNTSKVKLKLLIICIHLNQRKLYD